MKRSLILIVIVVLSVTAGVVIGVWWQRPNEEAEVERRLKDHIASVQRIMKSVHNISVDDGRYNLVKTGSITRPYACQWDTQVNGGRVIDDITTDISGKWVVEMYYDRNDKLWVTTSATNDIASDRMVRMMTRSFYNCTQFPPTSNPE